MKLTAVFVFLLFFSVNAQEDPVLLLGNTKPLISLEADANVFFWKVRPIDDSLAGPALEHNKAMNRGLRAGGALLFHLNTEFYLGAVWTSFRAQHTTEETNWRITMLDSNNRPVTVHRYGSISEEILLKFYGIRAGRKLELSDQIDMDFSITAGYVDYKEKADYVNYPISLEGGSLGIDIAISGIYRMDMNWSLFARAALFNCAIDRPLYTEKGRNIHRVPLNDPVILINMGIGGGIRYTFNKKEKKEKLQRYREDKPGSGTDRFRL